MELGEALETALLGEMRGLNRFVHVCKNMALVYLKSKISSGNYYLTEMNGELDDLAWDCIADLFERDEKGHFAQLEAYFGDEDLDELSEESLNIKTRRLVFSKVNDSIFRIFGDYDASLRKIIRNIKNACKEQDLKVERIDRSNYVIFQNELKQNKPLIPPEFLEIKLTHRITGTMNTVQIMGEVEQIFLHQKIYKKKLPLVTIARILRRAYVNNNDGFKLYELPNSTLFRNGELKKFLKDSIDQYREQFYSSYVEKDKFDEETFEAYMNSLEGILKNDYIKGCSYGDSYYDHLRQHITGLQKQTYRRKHRQYLEYMVKLVRSDLIHRLKKAI